MADDSKITRERPILFQGEMIRATLTDIKTMTRRIAKEFAGRDDLDAILRRFPQQKGCPFGEPGDRLWAREAFRLTKPFDKDSPQRVAELCLDAGYPKPWAPIQYEADGRRDNWCSVGTAPVEPGKLRPSIHMPRWASRITLEITEVRVERLQAISEADALAEGIEPAYVDTMGRQRWRMYPHRDGRGGPEDEVVTYIGPPHTSKPRESYKSLWLRLNGPGSWDANPLVWVVSFRRVQPC